MEKFTVTPENLLLQTLFSPPEFLFMENFTSKMFLTSLFIFASGMNYISIKRVL